MSAESGPPSPTIVSRLQRSAGSPASASPRGGGSEGDADPHAEGALDRILTGRVGVVDIGSNTVRLVVYDVPNRLPIPIFNEKAQCALGAGLGKSGRLNPKGVDEALRSLARYARLAGAMGVDRLELVATAAVRDASDGPAFVARVERICGLPVHVLAGAEEARLAAGGLLNGLHGADGVLGDLGGGSLDLVSLDMGAVGRFATLALGHLRLAEESGLRARIDAMFRGAPRAWRRCHGWPRWAGGRSIASAARGGPWRGSSSTRPIIRCTWSTTTRSASSTPASWPI